MSYYGNPYQNTPMYNPPAPDQLAQYRQPYQYQYQPAPVQSQPVQQAQQQSAMVWVRNRFEAENYPVAPNTAIALWDASGPFVHRKETDVSGRPILKTFRLVEVVDATNAANDPEDRYVTYRELKAMLGPASPEKAKEETVNE